MIPRAAFSPRDTASGAVFLGKMWLSNGYPEGVRDLWTSVDGMTWNRILEETPYGLYARLTVHDGKLWAVSSDVWSSEDGKNWVKVLDDSPFLSSNEVVTHDRKMWVFGNGPEVWSSTDGENWTPVTLNAPYGNRNAPAVTAFGGKLWLMGGSTPAPGKGFPFPDSSAYPDLDMHNDVWSSVDGVTWTLVTEDAPWNPRMWFSARSYAGRLWVLGGFDNDAYRNLDDTWYSTDGMNWQQVGQTASSWTPRHFPTTFAFDNDLWLIAGNAWPFENDVWKLHSTIPTTTTLTASSREVNYGAPVTFTVTIMPPNATGSVKFTDGSTSMSDVPISSGEAAFATSALTAGTHIITATYGGDSEHEPSSGSVTLKILPAGEPPEISKSFGAATILLGGMTSLTFTISNPNASLALTAVAFTDNLPEGLTIATPAGLTGSCGVGTIKVSEDLKRVSLSGGSLPASGSCTFRLDISATSAGIKTNTTSSVTATETLPGNPAVAVVEVFGPDITVAKSHTAMFAQGDLGRIYTITVTNAGLTPTTGAVTLTDILPDGLTATAISGPGWNCTFSNLVCTRNDTLAPSAAYPPVTVTVNVGSSAPASVTNTVHVTGGGEINDSNNDAADATAIIQLPDLRIAKAHDGSFAQGQADRIYSISVTNTGYAPTSATVTVTDKLPAALTAQSMTGDGWSCDLSTISCSRSSSLPVNTSYPAITLRVNVAADAPAMVVNQATVTGGVESDLSNNVAIDPTAVLTKPANLVATAISTTQVFLTWAAVPGAFNYQVLRSSNNEPYTVVGFPLINTFNDVALTPNTTYLYFVAATDSSNIGPSSLVDLATTTLFTDDPAVPGATTVKALHLVELRAAVESVRKAAALAPAAYTDAIEPGVLIRARHFAELRAALDQARRQVNLAAIQYTDPALAGALIKAAHIREMRSGVK